MTQDQKFIDAMHQAVADKGEDFEYPNTRCEYQTKGPNPTNPTRCLIGEALHRVGHEYNESWEMYLADTLLSKLGYSFSVAQAARRAQHAQDRKETWGTAIELFDKFLALSSEQQEDQVFKGIF